jgi:hypothetical protein
MTRELQTLVADEVTSAFIALEEGRLAIRAEIVELLQEEDLGIRSGPGRAHGVDVGDFWQAKSLDEKEGKGKRAFTTGVTGIRGAQGGVMMFSMLGSFLPSAATVLLASNPVLLGAGAIFGGMQLMDDRKRKVTARRQTARTQVRQFIDDVQFEVTNELTTMIRDVQRELRDEFTERLAELQRTYTETAKRAQEDAQKTQKERQERATEVTQSLAALAAVEQAAGGTGA